MTAADLAEIIRSPDFRTGLEELSNYLSSIKQERPIVHLLAKCLWQKKHLYALERNKHRDLTVWTPTLPSGQKETTMEFKLNFDCDMERLAHEQVRLGDRPLAAMWAEVLLKKANKTWNNMAKVYEDFCAKSPDIFVWIIYFRDLSRLDPEVCKWVCWSTEQRKWHKKYPNAALSREYVNIADDYLVKLSREVRPLAALLKEDIETTGDFPSIYHFRICEFAKSAEQDTAPARQEPRPPDASPDESEESY
jgi:hypothetical protein